MNIQPDPKQTQQITSYDNNAIKIDQNEYNNSIVIANQEVVSWPPKHIDQLKAIHFQILIEAQPEVILLGTGRHFHRPPQALLAEVFNAQIGIEWMDTRAACRSYNILLSDCRNVVAGLILEDHHD